MMERVLEFTICAGDHKFERSDCEDCRPEHLVARSNPERVIGEDIIFR